MKINFSKEIEFSVVDNILAEVGHLVSDYVESESAYIVSFMNGGAEEAIHELGEGYSLNMVNGEFEVRPMTMVTAVAETANDEDEDEERGVSEVRILDKRYMLRSAEVISRRTDVEACVNIVDYDDLDEVNEYVIIRTADMHAEGYNLGRYEITINYDMSYEIKPLDYMLYNENGSDRAIHPHISAPQDACFGHDTESSIADAIGSSDVVYLATILIEFLQTANTDDVFGERVSYWPEVN